MRLTALLLRHCHLQAAWRAATHHHPHPHPHQFLLHRTTTSLLSFTSRILSRTMSSDADYEAFLRRSQKDYSASYEGSNHAAAAGTISIQVENNPHPAIKALGERFYTSDVDEPFEGISFKWQKESLPTADEFGDLTGSGSGSDIEVLEPKDWDRRDLYKDVKDAVSAACAGAADLKVYRVEVGSRVTYYVVSLDEKGGKVVGVRVKAIES